MLARLVLLLSLITISVSSCKVDPCEEVTCLNGGVCDAGDCLCETGYEGINCETEQRLALVGDYTVEETCNLGSFSYNISMTANSAIGTEITLNNFGDFNFSISGSVSGTTVTFTDQVGNASTINGIGQLENGVLTIDYTMVTSAGQTLDCIMTCTPV